ncbi:AKAP7 2'5' RNA ligase-like domain-containing protein [Aspergillus varians]
MSENHRQNKGPDKPKPKRAPLTHFLCLPLVNTISLPQLESSLASFKASIPPSFPTNPDRGEQRQHPLIPDDAIRPVGTLHLTLGVMSLPTPERLDKALRFFYSLDITALLHRAGEIAAQQRLHTPPKPLTISLESMHALPRTRAATILHAEPVDRTSRLYSFCEALRDKFVEAGFLQGEYKNDPKKTRNKQQSQPDSTTTSINRLARETTQQSSSRVATTPSQPPPIERKGEPKLRPLLLHATIANTIYIRGRTRNPGGRNDRYTFDARDILTHYQNFYLDSDRRIPRSRDRAFTHGESKTSGNNHNNNHNSRGREEDGRKGKGKMASTGISPSNEGNNTGYPFVWARNFPIEALCICEMGAKKLDPRADRSGMNARLGEKYMVIAERGLVSGQWENG